MAAAFATVADLVARGRAVSEDEEARAEVALDDASAFLRAEIGWQVWPAAAVTVTRRGGCREVFLPGVPIASVTSVTVDDVALAADDYELINSTLMLCYTSGTVAVTYSVGYASPPDDLVSWTCQLASQMLARAEIPDGGIGAAPATLAVDDFRIGFSTLQQSGELAIPDRVLQRLRASYGSAVYVT